MSDTGLQKSAYKKQGGDGGGGVVFKQGQYKICTGSGEIILIYTSDDSFVVPKKEYFRSISYSFIAGPTCFVLMQHNYLPTYLTSALSIAFPVLHNFLGVVRYFPRSHVIITM